MSSNRCSMHKIKNFVAKRGKNYNTTDMFVSERNQLVTNESTTKKLNLITVNSCTIFWSEVENSGLIKWGVNRQVINDKLCLGILSVCFIPVTFIRQWLQSKKLLTHWIRIGGVMAGGTTSERKVVAIWFETRTWRTYKINVRICAMERWEGYKGIKSDTPYNVKLSEGRG